MGMVIIISNNQLVRLKGHMAEKVRLVKTRSERKVMEEEEEEKEKEEEEKEEEEG